MSTSFVGLKGQVQTQAEPKEFGSVIAQNPEQWQKLQPNQKLDVLNGFLKYNVENQPQWGSLDDQQKLDVKAGFIKKFVFGVPDDQLTNQPTQTGEFLDAVPGLFSGLAETGDFFVNPLRQEVSPGEMRFRASDNPAYQHNPFFKAGADIGNIGGTVAQYGLAAALGGLPGVAAVSGNQNIQKTAGGEQNIGQGVYNTILDTVLGKFNPQGSLVPVVAKNAAIGGAGGGAGYVGNQVLTGQKVTLEDLLKSVQEGAGTGAAISGGVHLGSGGKVLPANFGKKAPANVPQFDSNATRTLGSIPTAKRVLSGNVKVTRQVPNGALPEGMVSGSHNEQSYVEQRLAQAESRKVSKGLRLIEGATSVNEKATLQKRKQEFRKLYETLSGAANAAESPALREAFQKKAAETLQRHDAVAAELESKYGVKKEERKPATKEQLKKAIVAGIKARRMKGVAAAKFQNWMKAKFTQAERNIINAEIQKQQQAQAERAKAENQRIDKRNKLNQERRDEAKAEEAKAQAERNRIELEKQRAEEKAQAEALKKRRGDKIETQKTQKVIEASISKEPTKAAHNKRQAELNQTFGAVPEEKSTPAKSEKKTPKVLSPEEIEGRANELLAHDQAGEKGSLEGKLKATRAARDADHTKAGVDEARSNAIKSTHGQVLDRYFQKKAELAKTAKSAKVEAAKQKAKDEAIQPAQSQEGIVKTANIAMKNNEAVLIEYEAEGGKSGKGGESENANYRFKLDVPLETGFTKDGVAYVRVINAEGQIRTRLIHEKGSGSRIVGMTRVKEPALYKYEDGNVINIETGKVVPQEKVEGHFSSELRAIQEKQGGNTALEKYRNQKIKVSDIVGAKASIKKGVKKLQEGKKPDVKGEIIDPAKVVEDQPFEAETKAQSKEIYEDTTQEPC